MEIIPVEETEFEKNAKRLRAKLMPIIMQHLTTLIFAVVSGSVLLWVFNKYGEGRLIISCTVLLAVLLFQLGQRRRY